MGHPRVTCLTVLRTVLGVLRLVGGAVLVACALVISLPAAAQTVAVDGGVADASDVGPRERTVQEWLVRLQQASRVPNYVGTFVVSLAAGSMSSARIWHARQGSMQLERVEVLTGTPRSVYRRGDRVMTFFPQSHVVVQEQRDTNGVFPNLFAAGVMESTADHYSVRRTGVGRVAGFSADVLRLSPRDVLRFGYRIWSDKRTGMVLKTQTLDSRGQVLEQSAFSELQLDAAIDVKQIEQAMNNTEGFRVEQPLREVTTPEAEGWALKMPVPGFKSQACYRRRTDAASPLVQWIFSDGLATVSLFMEPVDPVRVAHEGSGAMGATHALVRRIQANDTQRWLITAVGEVPVQTLKLFIDQLVHVNKS